MSVLLRRITTQVLKELTAADVFNASVWTGNATIRDIATGLNSVAGDSLVWTRTRDIGNAHMLVDSVRGSSVRLDSSATTVDASTAGQFESFLADGYRLGIGTLGNHNGTGMVGWQFLKAAGFLDIITYTGDSVVGRTIPHSLGVDAGMVIVKNRTDTKKWYVQHKDRPANFTLSFDDAAESGGASVWNSTLATDVDVTLGGNAVTNGVGENYIMYVFAHNPEGLVQCGSYVGNGSGAGPAVTLGWVPQYILIKRATGGTGDWMIFDTARGITVGSSPTLEANTNLVESSGANLINLTADGFEVVSTSTDVNANGNEMIYMAIKGEI